MNLEGKDLKQVASEVRSIILAHMAQYGGHVGSPLGSIETIIALLRVYDFTTDKILFDVGHQMHAYKILTDRAGVFHTLDKKDGIGIFSNPAESPYDYYTGGHSGLAISAALGYSLHHPEYKSIALIGDGAMTGGQPYEALNQVGSIQPNMLVIYNDNDYSIAKNVGYLHSAKNLQKFSESLGLQYIGVTDGHDIQALIDILTKIKDITTPVFLHIKTIKGKGYAPAEADPITFHGIGPFDLSTGVVRTPESNPFKDYFVPKVTALMNQYPTLQLTSPAASRSSGLNDLQKLYPLHVTDTGMNEQHCVTFSAAMALNGNKVICFIPAIFMPRALDQITDVCLMNVPIVFVILNPGISKTGPTHQGIYTFPLLNSLPHAQVYNPATIAQFDRILDESLQKSCPVFIQKPAYTQDEIYAADDIIQLTSGSDLTVLSIGNMQSKALTIASKVPQVEVLHVVRIKPINIELITKHVSKTKRLLILEDGCVKSGIGQHVIANIPQHVLKASKVLGVSDRYPCLGSLEDVNDYVGLSDDDIVAAAMTLLRKS